MSSSRFLVVLATVMLGACSLPRSVTGPARDAGPLDAPGVDANVDAAEPDDAGVDAGVDVGVDGGGVDGCVAVVDELCDGADQDCDGIVDEDVPAQTCGLGACAATALGCQGGVVPVCTPMPRTAVVEVCGNGIDDDCDGAMDEPACGTLLFHYTADLLPDADGWSAQCSPGCPAGVTMLDTGRVRIRGGGGQAISYRRAWAVAAAGVTSIEFRARAESSTGLDAAFVLAASATGRIIVAFVPGMLQIDTDCGATTIALPLGEPTFRVELQAGRARTYLNGTMIDERAECVVSGFTPSVVEFGSGNPSVTGELVLDDLFAYTTP